jgi:hypothetical protein
MAFALNNCVVGFMSVYSMYSCGELFLHYNSRMLEVGNKSFQYCRWVRNCSAISFCVWGVLLYKSLRYGGTKW